jgi:hypothetical protein
VLQSLGGSKVVVSAPRFVVVEMGYDMAAKN